MTTVLRAASALAVVLVLVAGRASTAGTRPGTLDRTWGDRGLNRVLPVDAGSEGEYDAGAGALVQDHGRILLVANAYGDGDPFPYLFRFSAAGRRDPSFGNHGAVMLPAADYSRRFGALLPSGKIITLSGARVFRLNADGRLDRSYGVNGSVRLAIGRCAYEPVAAAAERDGAVDLSVLGCGRSFKHKEHVWRVMRVLPSGRIDRSYGVQGRAAVSIGVAEDVTAPSLLLPQPDGSLIEAGDVNTGDSLNPQAGLIRLRRDGTLDATFGDGGYVIVTRPFAHVRQIWASAGGGIVVSGWESSFDCGRAVVGRFHRDGSPDTVWDPDGIKAFALPGCVSFAPAPDGKLLFVGGAQLWRMLPDGTPDPSFGVNGSAALPRGAFDQLLVQPDGKIVVAGEVSLPAGSAHRLVQTARING